MSNNINISFDEEIHAYIIRLPEFVKLEMLNNAGLRLGNTL